MSLQLGKKKQETKAFTHQASAFIMLAGVPLAKASNGTKLRINVGRDHTRI